MVTILRWKLAAGESDVYKCGIARPKSNGSIRVLEDTQWKREKGAGYDSQESHDDGDLMWGQKGVGPDMGGDFARHSTNAPGERSLFII